MVNVRQFHAFASDEQLDKLSDLVVAVSEVVRREGAMTTISVHSLGRSAFAAAACAVAACALVTPADAQTAMTLARLKPHTADLDDMLKRRVVRVLVPYSKTYFFIDRGDVRGIDGELGLELEKWLNQRYKQKGAYRVHVAFIPTQRDQLFKRLDAGYGDIAAGGLTVTPERKAVVDFAAAWASNIKELLVTGPAAPPVANLADLGGREVRVRASSS